MDLLNAFTLFTIFFIPLCLAASADVWQTHSIYQLLTDRFAVVGDAGAPCNTEEGLRCGGSWKGVTAHLDYIQALGFDAVWISPVVSNLEGNTKYGQAYHGYWTENLSSLNSHFGSPDDLKKLASELHTRSMLLMIDVVVNHMAAVPNQESSNIQSKDAFNYTSLSFSDSDDYHPFCWITDYTNQTEVEQCWLGDSEVTLVDVDTENPDIVEQIHNWIHDLVQDYGIDGIRIDTVKHVRKDFWPGFVQSAGVFTMGEVLIGDVDYLNTYTQAMDSVLDYPNYFALVLAFSSPSGNIQGLEDLAIQSQNTYRQGLFMTGSFLENHDNPRFQSYTQDQALVKNAMTWSFVTDGIPILYYGQEQGLQGAKDPYNREALWLTGYETVNTPFVNHVKDLNMARKVAISTNKNDFLGTPMTFIPQDDSSAMAIWKPPMLSLLTNIGSSGSASWNISGTYAADEDIIDVLTCTALKLDGTGSLVVVSDGGMPRVLMPLSTGMCSKSLSATRQKSGSRQEKTSFRKTFGWIFLILMLTGYF